MHPDEEIDRDAIYMGFTVVPPQEKFNRNHDYKVGLTIMWLVANAFKQNKRAILFYVCSAAEGQARNRSILFSKWYRDSPLKEKINLTKKVKNGNYCGVLYSKKHPNADNIELAFADFDPDHKFLPTVEEIDDLMSLLDDDDDENISEINPLAP